jgi:CRISPR-associated protein Cas10/Csm1 subtype III-A
MERQQLETTLIEFGYELLRHRLDSQNSKPVIPEPLQEIHHELGIDYENLAHENRIQLIFQALTDTQAQAPTLLPITELSLAALENPSATEKLDKTFDDIADKLRKNGSANFGTFGYLMSYFGSRVALGAKAHPTLSVATYWKVLAASAFAQNNGEVLLFSGDVAGLSEFMRVKTAKQAAKNMRARSFYVQMLSQVLARTILRELDLPLCNLLFEGASRFLLMLPPDADLYDLLLDLNRRVLLLHHGELAPQFAQKPVSLSILFDPDQPPPNAKEEETAFQRAMRELYEDSSRAGQQRFQILAATNDEALKNFFEPFGGEDAEYRCAWCGVELEKDDKKHPKDKDDGKRRCSQCAHFGWSKIENLAKQLALAKYLHLCDSKSWLEVKPASLKEFPMQKMVFDSSDWQVNSPTDFPTWQECLECFGFAYSFPQNFDAAKDGEWLVLNPGWKLQTQDLPWANQKLSPDVIAGWRWVGKATPFDEGLDNPDVRDTNDICRDALVRPEGKTEGWQGSKLYGLLSMDGDSMGSLFKKCRNIFQYLTLSEAVGLFFEGRTNQLCESVAKKHLKYEKTPSEEAKRAYLLYAGGDDLLILSAWHVLPELAVAIRDDYARYVESGHFQDKYVPEAPALSISAAIVIEHEKFPVYELTKEAHAALQRSKHFWLGRWTKALRREQFDPNRHRFEITIEGKTFYSGCIHFLGRTLPWPVFMKAINTRNEIHGILQAEAHRSLIQRLLVIETAFDRDWKKYEELLDRIPATVAEALGGFEADPRQRSRTKDPVKRHDFFPMTAEEKATFQSLTEEERRAEEKHRKCALPFEVRLLSGEWQWQAAYSLLRYAMMPPQKEKPELQRDELQRKILALREEVLTIPPQQLFHPLAYLGLAARWVELLTKKRSEEYDRREEHGE